MIITNGEYEFTKLKKQAKDDYGITLDGRQDWSFFVDEDGEFKLHKKCEKCSLLKQCGQSFRANLSCSKGKKTEKQEKKQVNKKNKK